MTPKRKRKGIQVTVSKREADALWMALDALMTARDIDCDPDDANRWKILRDKFARKKRDK